MAMTDDEQRRLDRIARMMRADDPALERALSTGRFRDRRQHAAGTALAAVAITSLFVSLWLGQGVLILASWVLFAVGMLLRTFAD